MNENQFGALLEHIDDQLTAIKEGQVSMANVPGYLVGIDNRLQTIEDDLEAIERDIKDQSVTLPRQGAASSEHDQRISGLEEAS